jgi:hypothetical protein
LKLRIVLFRRLNQYFKKLKIDKIWPNNGIHPVR